MTNRESGERNKAGRLGLGGGTRDVTIHFQPDRRQKPVDLVRLTFGNDLDSAVRKIADMARNFKASGERLAREAKTHALNAARETNSATISRHRIILAASTGARQVVVSADGASESGLTAQEAGADRLR